MHAQILAVPVVMLHAWADSFYRYIHLIGRLTTGDRPAFDVIVPSLPGFDFSDQRPAGTGEQDSVFAAEVVAELLEGLGYDRYLVHGGDWGAAIGQEIARAHPDRVIGLHLTELQFATMYLLDPTETTDPPKEYAERFFDVRRFTKMPTGGHFAALEVPDLVAEDIWAFVAELGLERDLHSNSKGANARSKSSIAPTHRLFR